MVEGKTDPYRRTDDEAALRGHPSYVWRAGQDRRLALVRRWARLDGAAILDAGCGVGMYTAKFCEFSPHVAGVEIDPAVAAQARAHTAGRGAASPGIIVARGEALPFADRSFDVIFSHEVIEHVDDDRQAAAEIVRGPGTRRPHRPLLPEPPLPLRDPRPLLARQISLRQHPADQLAAGPAAQPPRAARQGLHRCGADRPVRGASRPDHPPPGHLSRLRQHRRDPPPARPLAAPRPVRRRAHPAAGVRAEPFFGAGTEGLEATARPGVTVQR